MSEFSHTSETPNEKYKKNCTVLTYQSANVSVPITVKPRVNTGPISTFCCGEPKVTPASYTVKYNSGSGSGCCYTISQNICIEIPVEFSANAYANPPRVICGDVVTDKI